MTHWDVDNHESEWNKATGLSEEWDWTFPLTGTESKEGKISKRKILSKRTEDREKGNRREREKNETLTNSTKWVMAINARVGKERAGKKIVGGKETRELVFWTWKEEWEKGREKRKDGEKKFTLWE